MNKINKDIGKRLVECRKKNNLTQEKMAEILNISVNHYGTIERGFTAISVDKVVLLKNKLNLDLNYILAGEASEKYNKHNTRLMMAVHQIKKIVDRVLEANQND